MADQPLLTPLSLAGLELPNRVIMSPMTRARADNAQLAPTALHATYYRQRASAGLIVTEGTWVNEQAIGAVNVPGIYTDVQVDGWKQVTWAVHQAGGRIFCQLAHTGALSQPNPATGTYPLAPSAVNVNERAFGSEGMKPTPTPEPFTRQQIEQTVRDYGTAARNARRAGFDGVEIHGQGSQLIPQFLNPLTNLRDDEYGGSPAGRARFLLAVVEEVRSVWDTPRVGVKISPYWTAPMFRPTTATCADYGEVVRILSTAGLAYLHLMGPRYGAVLGPELIGTEPFDPWRRYKANFPGQVITNVLFTQASGNQIIAEGTADAVSFAAQWIANPDLVDRFARGLPLAEADPATYYAGGAKGYIDYKPFGANASLSPGSDR
jgi:N-ethylmaleimide reductase